MKSFYEKRDFNNTFPLLIFTHEDVNFLAHWHTEVEFAYVLEGSITMGINSDKVILEKGDLAVCSSGDIHYFDSRDTHSNIMTLIFKPELVNCHTGWPKNVRFISPFIRSQTLDSLGLSNVGHILDTIAREIHEQDSAYDMLIKAKLYELCGIFLRNVPTSNETQAYKSFTRVEILQDILSYVQDNFKSDMTIESIAAHFNISSCHFCRLFKAHTGMNFKTHLNTLRTSYAEELITHTDKPITEIALESGFNSIRTFNRVYKSIKECTPSEMR